MDTIMYHKQKVNNTMNINVNDEELRLLNSIFECKVQTLNDCIEFEEDMYEKYDFLSELVSIYKLREKINNYLK